MKFLFLKLRLCCNRNEFQVLDLAYVEAPDQSLEVIMYSLYPALRMYSLATVVTVGDCNYAWCLNWLVLTFYVFIPLNELRFYTLFSISLKCQCERIETTYIACMTSIVLYILTQAGIYLCFSLKFKFFLIIHYIFVKDIRKPSLNFKCFVEVKPLENFSVFEVMCHNI